jgi:hypothetical protein
MMLVRLVSWNYLYRHILRWTLTVAGIVLGVGVFVAANASPFQAVDQTIEDRMKSILQFCNVV